MNELEQAGGTRARRKASGRRMGSLWLDGFGEGTVPALPSAAARVPWQARPLAPAPALPHVRAVPVAKLTRAECAEWVLPCQLTRCRHHLDNPAHARSEAARALTKKVCSLDFVGSELTQDEVSLLLGISRQRVAQIESHASSTLAKRVSLRVLHATEWPEIHGETAAEGDEYRTEIEGSRARRLRHRKAGTTAPRTAAGPKSEAAREAAE